MHIRFIHRNWRTIFIGLTIISDILAIIVSGLLAFYLRNHLPNLPYVPTHIFIGFTVFFGVVLLTIGMTLGLYRATFHSNTQHQYFLAGKTYVYSILIILSILYVFHSDDFPRRFTFIFLSLILLFFLLGRIILNKINSYLREKGHSLFNTLLIGYENGGMKVFERFTGFPELGYKIKGVVQRNDLLESHKIQMYSNEVSRFKLSELEDIVVKHSIDRIFVPSLSCIENGYAKALEVSKRYNIKLKVLSHEADTLLRLANIQDIAGITIYSPERQKIEKLKKIVKRIFDIFSSSILLIIFSPIFLITSIAILIESGTPIFFKHKRTGATGGKEFDFYKFRSMIQNADELKESLINQNETDGALFKIKNDPRLTKVGRIIRKFSIDELPQLINVLKGDMSLVGPRPLPLSDFDKIDSASELWDYVKGRGRIKPGMTGLWQVSGRSNIGFREMIWLDLYYAENHSLLFDLEILFATIPVVLFGKGAY